MPAIQPARLKQQSAELAARFREPASFVRQLHALLDQYSDHTHHPGQSGEPSPLKGSYSTPPPVMHQVWRDLLPMINRYPADVLPLCDALWAEPNLDLQLLAARLLGEIPVSPPEPVIERLQAWVAPGLEKRLLDGVLECGLRRLQLESPDLLMHLVDGWLASNDLPSQQAGLRALPSLIKRAGADTLPGIFKALTPYLRVAPSKLRPDILAALSALAECSPQETAYVLHQNLSAPDNPDTAWLVRQVLDEFPADTSKSLRAALRMSL
jgi:DNA alkylation repair enzyme